jgi:hypothetical protein
MSYLFGYKDWETTLVVFSRSVARHIKRKGSIARNVQNYK